MGQVGGLLHHSAALGYFSHSSATTHGQEAPDGQYTHVPRPTISHTRQASNQCTQRTRYKPVTAQPQNPQSLHTQRSGLIPQHQRPQPHSRPPTLVTAM